VNHERWRNRVRLYFDARDWWIGAYFADGRVYICPLPCLVIKISYR